MSNVLPEGWRLNQLSDICEVVGGGTPERIKSEYWGGNIPWASPTEITSLKSRYISKTKESITPLGLAKSSAKLHPVGTLLMTSRASIGYVAINKVPMTTNQGFQSLRCGDDVNNEFLYQYITWIRPELEKLSAGSTFSEISAGNTKKVKVVTPPLPEQQKIAKILTSVDEVIEKTQAQIDKLKDLKTGMMQELLTNGIGHTEFKDSTVGRIPADWDVVRFKNIFIDYKYGPRFSSKDYDNLGNVKTIRGTDVSASGEINYENVPKAKLAENVVKMHSLKDGDLVMITTADCGVTAIFRQQNIPYIASAYAVKLTPNERVNSEFITYFMQTATAKSQVEAFVRKGTVANLPGSDVMAIQLALPPLDEQKEISKILSHLDQNISLKMKKLTKVQGNKKALMQDLLTGKVRVNA